MAAPRATEAAMRRAITAWKDAGLEVGTMQVGPDGTITLSKPSIDSTPIEVQTNKPKQWSKIG